MGAISPEKKTQTGRLIIQNKKSDGFDNSSFGHGDGLRNEPSAQKAARVSLSIPDVLADSNENTDLVLFVVNGKSGATEKTLVVTVSGSRMESVSTKHPNRRDSSAAGGMQGNHHSRDLATRLNHRMKV